MRNENVFEVLSTPETKKKNNQKAKIITQALQCESLLSLLIISQIKHNCKKAIDEKDKNQGSCTLVLKFFGPINVLNCGTIGICIHDYCGTSCFKRICQIYIRINITHTWLHNSFTLFAALHNPKLLERPGELSKVICA